MHEYDLGIYISRGLIDKIGLHATGDVHQDIEMARALDSCDRKTLCDYLSQVFLRYDGRDKDKLYMEMLHL